MVKNTNGGGRKQVPRIFAGMGIKEIVEAFNGNGFHSINGFYAPEYCREIIQELEKRQVFDYSFADAGDHNLLKGIDFIRSLAWSEDLLFLARSIIGKNAIPFHAIVLDKTRENNWGLDWHQDLKIAVNEKIRTDGYTNWSLESGIVHVVPPKSILENMLCVRIHLDDCDASNGALWVLPGTHQSGIIAPEQIPGYFDNYKIFECPVKAGGIMLMSPLLLHKSPYSLTSQSRRVLQVEYRSCDLHNGLSWYN